jgi:hypothetical protein
VPLINRVLTQQQKFARGPDGICFASERAFYEALSCGHKSAFRAIRKYIKKNPDTRLRAKTFEAGQRNPSGRIFSHRKKLMWFATRQKHRAERRGQRKCARQKKEREERQALAGAPVYGPSKREWQRAQQPATFPIETVIANADIKAFREEMTRTFATKGSPLTREEQLAALAALDTDKPPPS